MGLWDAPYLTFLAMSFQHLTVLLPCYSLEDFTTERPEDESEQLLSAWSALWHPALVAAAGKMPHWAPASRRPRNRPATSACCRPAAKPCCRPTGCRRPSRPAPTSFATCPRRRQMVAAALDALGPAAAVVEPALAADFLALGFCHLAVELLTRKLRYMSQRRRAGLGIALARRRQAGLSAAKRKRHAATSSRPSTCSITPANTSSPSSPGCWT